MILSRHRMFSFAAIVAGAILVWGLLMVAWMSTAHAQVAAPPPAAPLPSSGISIEAIMLIVIAFLSFVRTLLQFISPRTKTPVDDNALAFVNRVLELAGIIRQPAPIAPVSTVTHITPLAPLGDVTTTTVTTSPVPARDPQSGRIRLSVVTFMSAIISLIAVGALSCAARQRTAAGVKAFLQCQAPNVDAALLEEAKGVTIAALDKWIAGDGRVDTAGLREEARPLKSDLMRCAFEGAIAALLAPSLAKPDAPAAAPRAIDRAALRAEWAAARAELGWQPLAAEVQ